jgi:hypothetical protein
MHAEYSKYLYIKVIKKIRELFIYSIKLGPRDPLIKKNGDTFIRYPKQVKKLTRDNYSPAVSIGLVRFWKLRTSCQVWTKPSKVTNNQRTNISSNTKANI